MVGVQPWLYAKEFELIRDVPKVWLALGSEEWLKLELTLTW